MNTHVFLRAEARLLAEAKDCDKVCYCCGGREQEPPSGQERLAALGLRGREWHRLAGRYFASLNAILLLLAGIFPGGRRRRLMRRAK